MTSPCQQEADRIRAEYARRAAELPPDFYALRHPANLFMQHGNERSLARALNFAGVASLGEQRVLEVGCGTGQWLDVFERFGVPRTNLAGIELGEDRFRSVRDRFAAADIRLGNAAKLPWENGAFDIVTQKTVFTSILSPTMKQQIAAEMQRVLKPNGLIIWLDFGFNNPRNPNVQGIGAREIAALFPNAAIRRWRITLAPPLARRVVPLSWACASLLQSLRVLNTHILAVIRSRSCPVPPVILTQATR